MLRPHLNAPWVHRLLRKIGFVNVIRCHRLPHSRYTSAFGDDYILISIGNYNPRCWMTFKHTTPLFINWDPTQVRRFELCAICYQRLFHPPSSTSSCDSPSSSTSFSFQGAETPRPGYAQTTTSVTEHHDTTASPTSTRSELEGSAWNMVAALGSITS